MASDTGRDVRSTEDAPEATASILNANPFVGLERRHVVQALGRWAGRLSRHPGTLASEAARTGAELGRVVLGRSEAAPDRGDRRFSDPTWSENPLYRRWMQAYLVGRAGLHRLVEGADLDWKSMERARFGVTMLTEALAPTNTVPGNPAAVKRAYETGGRSVLAGARHFVGDLRGNGGMPRMVDTRPFEVGRDLAVTPGAVVHRTDVYELIQYRPVTDEVLARPLVLVPPQINKYYVMDLAPGRSFTEWAVGQGVPFFTMSWRNPTAAQRHWDLDTYVGACKEAVGVANDIMGTDDAHLLGLCAGGITSAVLLGHLAGVGDRRVRTVTFAVTILDTAAPSMLGMFASRRTIEAAKQRSARAGVLEGRDMSRVFAWLRPNDLVWNYWVNNYLLGKEPPAFDVLVWNDDNTRLPAGLHADFLDMFLENPLVRPGAVEALGTPVDLTKVDQDAYVLAGATDHIVPWSAAYRTADLLGGDSAFVLSSSGHIQSLVNPPGNPKARYRVGEIDPDGPDAWVAGAEERRGSWWEHWLEWLEARSDGRRPAPKQLGNRRHRPVEDAPGRYVHQR